MQQPELTTPPASGFPARLAAIIGTSSVRGFARRAGVSDTFLRQCLAGRTEPTRPKLIAIAEAGQVTVEWLVTGIEQSADADRAGPDHSADQQLLQSIIEVTESVLHEGNHTLSPAKKAHLISALYDMHAGSDRALLSRDVILKLITCAI